MRNKDSNTLTIPHYYCHCYSYYFHH